MSIKASLSDIFSEQELQVFLLKEQGMTAEQISRELNRSRRHINIVLNRINTKIDTLQKNKIIIDYAEENIEISVKDNEIKEIFEEAQNKTLKLTLNQAIFLQNTENMSTSAKKPTQSEVRTRLGLKSKEKEVVTRKWSDEEREEFIKQWHERQYSQEEALEDNKKVFGLLMTYEALLHEGSQNIEKMAEYERILKAHGLIYKTPYINKLNSKTGTCLRAASSGKKVLVINDAERHLLPPDAKLVETSITSIDDKEIIKESVWVVEKW